MLRLLAAVLALSLLPVQALAKEIYVSKTTGANDNPGTKEKPLKLLWKVFEGLENGDVVRVAEGIYNGEKKAGVMPKITKSVVFEGGWTADFSSRDPFKHLTIITAAFDQPGATSEVFHCDDRKLSVTIDGFLIDRGGGAIYYADGEVGANKRIAGHKDCTPWGYRNLNRKMSGSDPSIELLGETMTVRNNIIINSPWWGIYVKGGGKGTITIENNLVLGFQGRGIEAITGGGWGAPTWHIRHNTVAFGWEMEGRGISLDPRPDNGKVLVENNVVAFTHQTGVMTKFPPTGDALQVVNNLFYFNRLGDYGSGGSGCCNAADLDDEVSFKQSKNVHELPKFVAKVAPAWLDRYTMTKSLTNKLLAKDADLDAARAAVGLTAWQAVGFEPSANYSALPQGRASYDLGRYPAPFKEGEGLDAEGWAKFVLPMIGQDGERGIQAAFAK